MPVELLAAFLWLAEKPSARGQQPQQEQNP
jgi:hypothetical protein